MKAFLMFRDRDFDPQQLLSELTFRDRMVDKQQQLPSHERSLLQDLDLATLFHAMGGEDQFLRDVVQKAILSGPGNDVDTILYRQQILKDCLQNPAVIRQVYGLAVEAVEGTRKCGWGISGHYPSSMLYSATDLLEMLVGMLRRLRNIAKLQASRFESDGFRTLFAMLVRELSDEYLVSIGDHLTVSKFRKGVLVSAELGNINQSNNLTLRKASARKQKWYERVLGNGPPAYTFHLHERDEAGAKIVSDMRQRGISRVAVALAQSADHVLSFFKMLRTELAFYVGCMNLHALLTSKQRPVCFPNPAPAGVRMHRFNGLYEVCLSLHLDDRIVGNAADADGKNIIIITGANQGGKSSFLRSLGLAQLMMQCGMFVGAEIFEAEICPALFTHYKRKEDATMKSGKLDEELARIGGIVEHIVPNAIVLFNESFAATNGREGSEIARQIVSALLEKHVKIFYVTHLYEFAHGFFDQSSDDILFLRAERKSDGTRTFRILEGEPLETSYGEDLYRQIFDVHGQLENDERGGSKSAAAR